MLSKCIEIKYNIINIIINVFNKQPYIIKPAIY